MKRPLFKILTCGIALLLAGCAEPERPIEKTVVRPVKLYEVPATESNRMRRFPGTVKASETADLSFRLAGELTFLENREAQPVKRGQVLARLDSRDARNQLAERQAAFDLAVSDEERKKSLFQENVIAQASYDRALAELQARRASLALALDQVDYTVLKAPFDGIISKISLENHQFVQVRQTVMTIESLDNIDISFEVPEQIVIDAYDDPTQLDYQPEIRFPSNPDTVYHARYKENSSQVTRGSQTYNVILTMPRPKNLNLLSGMTAEVTLDLAVVTRTTAADPNVTVPSTAIAFPDDLNSNSDGARVWRYDAESQTVQSVSVSLGTVSDSGVAVLAGLAPGDKIVSAGHQHLAENQRVKPWVKERGL